jgi:hypothetical protein
MVDIPLIGDPFKKKVKEQQQPPMDEDPEIDDGPSEQDKYFQDMSDEQEFGAGRQSSAKDTTGIWDKKVFRTLELKNDRLSRFIVPSMGMSNYPTKIDQVSELSVAQNRLIMGQDERLDILAERFEKNKDKYWLYEENIDPNENPFIQHLSLLSSKNDAGNRSYLSVGMAGLREMNAVHKHITREEKKPIDQKLGVRTDGY